MSLIRFAGRVLHSAYFAMDGYQLVTKPDRYSDEIAKTTDRLIPAIQSVLPPDIADRLPEKSRSWTRIFGIAQLTGAALYATGLLRRPGAYLLALSTTPRLIAAVSSRQKTDALIPAAMLGSTLVATQDTAGKPNLRWRAENSTRHLARAAERTGQQVSREAKRSARALKKEAKRNAKAARKQAARLGVI